MTTTRVSTIDDLRSEHEAFLDEALQKCLLTSRSEPLKEKIQNIFTAVAELRSLLNAADFVVVEAKERGGAGEGGKGGGGKGEEGKGEEEEYIHQVGDEEKNGEGDLVTTSKQPLPLTISSSSMLSPRPATSPPVTASTAAAAAAPEAFESSFDFSFDELEVQSLSQFRQTNATAQGGEGARQKWFKLAHKNQKKMKATYLNFAQNANSLLKSKMFTQLTRTGQWAISYNLSDSSRHSFSLENLL